MAEIQDEAEWIQRKIGSLKEDLVQELDQHALLAFMQLSRETQTELEAAMPALKGLQGGQFGSWALYWEEAVAWCIFLTYILNSSFTWFKFAFLLY